MSSLIPSLFLSFKFLQILFRKNSNKKNHWINFFKLLPLSSHVKRTRNDYEREIIAISTMSRIQSNFFFSCFKRKEKLAWNFSIHFKNLFPQCSFHEERTEILLRGKEWETERERKMDSFCIKMKFYSKNEDLSWHQKRNFHFLKFDWGKKLRMQIKLHIE